MKTRIPIALGLALATGAMAQESPPATAAAEVSGAVEAFVASLSMHPGVDVEIDRFEDGRLDAGYRRAFAEAARDRVASEVERLIEEMLRDGCTAKVSVEFPGERFSGFPDPSSVQKDFEDSIVLTRSSACYSTDLPPEEVLGVYSSRDVRMAAQSRMEDVYEEDGLTCYAVGGVPLLLSPTRSCNEVRGTATERMAIEHSQTVRSEADGHQPVYFKESVKVVLRLPDGRLGLGHVTLTRSTGLGGLEKRLGRGKIEDSLRQQTRVLAERLNGPPATDRP